MVRVIRHQFDPAKTIMVGDRLDTDIAFGKMGSLATLLVLTGIIFTLLFRCPDHCDVGVSSVDEVGVAGNPVPDYIVQSLGDLVQKE